MNRDDFLKRIREAAQAVGSDPLPLPPAPSVAVEPRLLAERFRREHEAVLGRAHLVNGAREARPVLRELLVDAGTFVRSDHAVLDEVGLAEETAALSPAPAAEADVGITGAEFGVAATGSVVLSSRWGRLAALLPYRHVVVLRASQLLADLPDVYGRLDPQATPGAWGFHTGPSKSADIEQVMALGVHGPGRVDVIVLLDAQD